MLSASNVSAPGPEGEGRSRWLGRVSGVEIEIGQHLPASPASCACCGQTAARTRVETCESRQILVPYCESCQRHAAFSDTRRLSAVLAGALGALIAAGSAMLIGVDDPWLVLAGALAVALVLPAGVLVLLGKRLELGHVSRGRAVVWLSANRVFCARSEWGRELAEKLVLPVRASRRSLEWSRWLLAPAAGVLVVAALWFGFGRGAVLIVNLTDRTLVVYTGTTKLATVLPTPTEARSAGVRIALRSGRHVLGVRSLDGVERQRVEVSIAPGADYLFAPGDHQRCFWVETTHYGRERASAPEVTGLAGEGRFWRLPSGIDTWFAANPAQPSEDFGTSGGSMRALRQGAACPPQLASQNE
jgi:hypothetical protein